MNDVTIPRDPASLAEALEAFKCFQMTQTERAELVAADRLAFRVVCYTTAPGVEVTPALLLAIAVRANDERELLSGAGDQASRDVRSQFYTLEEDALVCGQWMESHGLKSACNVGPFGPAEPRRGQMVTIRKGSLVRTTHPSGPRTSARAQEIKVDSAHRGYVDHSARFGEEKVREGEVSWAGAGGYWRRTALENVST